MERATSARVSVVVPAYNAAPFIAEALHSVFAQTFRDFEVIVVNDGSPDTPELERALQPYAGRIVYLQQANAGPSAARNAGIRRARGEYVAFLDSDDAWEPEFLALQVALIESQPGVSFVYSDLRLAGRGPGAGGTYMQQCPSRGPAVFESILREDCQAPASATLARRQAVIDAGLFDETVRRAEDYDLWLRLTWRGARALYRREVLGRHRLRGDSLSADGEAMLESAARVLAKLDGELQLSAPQRAALRRKRASLEASACLLRGKRLLAEGRPLEAREQLERANAHLGRFRIALALWGLRLAPGLAGKVIGAWGKLRARRRG